MGFFRDNTSKKNAKKDAKKAIATIAGVELPELEKLKREGDFNAVEQSASSLGSFKDDPLLRNAQLGALGDLQETVDADGLDAQTMSRLNQVQGDISSAERGNREAILANQRARGLGGSGVELAAQLSNQQGAAQRANSAGLEVASIGEQRKSEALRDLANLGGSIRGQDFGQAEAKAAAKDRINQFNTGLSNQARQYNVQEKQRISDYNKTQLPQQQFQNNLNKAQGVAGGYQNMSGLNQANGQAADNRFSQVLGAGIGGLATMGAAGMFSPAKALATPANNPLVQGPLQNGVQAYSDERVKEDVKPFDSSQMLDELTGYKYNYKEPEKHGEGEQVGIMAGDLESVAPQAVSPDSEGVKRIDYSKLGGPILAALAEMNKRLKNVEGK